MKKMTKQIGSPHRQPIIQAREKAREEVLAKADEIFERYIHGESMKAIFASMRFPLPDSVVRTILMTAPETMERYQNANVMRSHYLVESAVEFGMQAAAIGDSAGLRVAVDTAFKMASKLNQAQYGDANKVELTGKDGGPVKLLALSDEDLMKIAAQGKGEQA